MMKSSGIISANRDDSLFGLLASYKANSTYVRVIVHEDEQRIEVQITDNPKNWKNEWDSKDKKHRVLRRLEIGVNSLSIKYIAPEHLLKSMGPFFGFKLPADSAAVADQLHETGIYCITSDLKYKFRVLQGVRKLINLKPHKKYELLEKSIVMDQDKSDDRTV
ncbi:MAG TPA: hypothetical protein PK573_10830 [Spirochaetota bacterium]|nr:hypothetical protein [Spirochaetota bacterium]HRZ25281.1 hypothetical protein [Spirochaetota bacterium]HSA13550.1 hypothetical protein [Spirochaetota bacterium]